MKAGIVRYFRYHHYHTTPAKESHRAYITALGCLEGLAGVEDLADKGQSADESWREIRDAINSLDGSGIQKLYDRMIRGRC